jgi:hypothetical protein
MSSPYPQYPASPPAAPQFAPHTEVTPGAHPFLREPKLYISNLSPTVTDVDLAHALEYCVPFRPSVMRDGTGQPINGQPGLVYYLLNMSLIILIRRHRVQAPRSRRKGIGHSQRLPHTWYSALPQPLALYTSGSYAPFTRNPTTS